MNRRLSLLFAITCCLASVSLQGAQDGFEPILDSLQYRQKQAHLSAAPSGQDEPLETKVTPVFVSDAAVRTVASSLEKVAEVRTQELTLEESRQTQALDQELQQFGYELFQRGMRAEDLDHVSVPADYEIGPGDTLVVQLYGKRNVEYTLVVTREGKLLIPEFGPMTVAGLTFAEVRELIIEGFSSRVIGAKTAVTMGGVRSLQVRLSGDVNVPGIYAVNGLATLVDALLASGGVKPSGTLRNIQLVRQGKLVRSFDLYDLLLRGDTSEDISLKHNDVIFVPPIGDVVYVGGEVQRPAIYELDGTTTLAEVLEMAGGTLPTASIAASYIERIVTNSYRTLVNLSEVHDAEGLLLAPSDYVRVMPVDDKLDQIVLLSGHVKRPGGYQFTPGMTVSQLLGGSDTLLRNADLDFALLKREARGTKRTYVEYLQLDEILRFPGSEADLMLQPRDELIVFDLGNNRSQQLARVRREMEIQATPYAPAAVVSFQGHVRFSGQFPLQHGIRLLSALSISGGMLPGVDMEYAIVLRTLQPSGLVKPLHVRLAAALATPDSSANPTLKAGDQVYLFDANSERSKLLQPALERLKADGRYLDDPEVVTSEGLVRSRGEFPLTENMRASDLLCASDGLQTRAHGISAELSRTHKRSGMMPEIEHIELDADYLVQICSARKTRAALVAAHAMDQMRKHTAMPVAAVRQVNDVVGPIRFETGTADLPKEFIRQIQAELHKYRNESDVRVLVVGHTDNTPLSAKTAARHGDNVGLSLARAWEVANLIHAGLPEDIVIEVEGRGASQPVATNLSEAGRRANRRVEVHLRFNAAVNPQHPDSSGLTELPQYAEADLGPIYADKDPLLQSGDQLTFVQREGWRELRQVTLAGEVVRPGIYVIDRGETLCSVMSRAGGLTSNAWAFGAEFVRRSTRARQQKTLNDIQDQLDDLMFELSLSHSVNNAEKTPAAGNKDAYLKVLDRLKRAEPNGREVIDLERAMTCNEKFDLVMEDGDVLNVPLRSRQVSVMGQVYVPTSHAYREERTIRDYIELSGGATVIGRLADAYAVQANGEVLNMRGRGFKSFSRRKPEPGAVIYVPLNVDRMNTTERIQAWTRSLVEVALFAGVIL